MHGAAQRVDNCEQQLKIFTKAMPRSDREQELITVIQEETKRTEEKKEVGYRSPTWSILRVLQKINKPKRIEGEAIMSAPSFFQSAGRGDLKFWGEDDGPTIVVWKVYRNQNRISGRKRWASRRIGWFGAGRGKKTKNNARLKLMEKKSSQTAVSKPNPKQERRRIRKETKDSQFAGKRGGDRATSNAR